jgi:hypothetical protein
VSGYPIKVAIKAHGLCCRRFSTAEQVAAEVLKCVSK